MQDRHLLHLRAAIIFGAHRIGFIFMSSFSGLFGDAPVDSDLSKLFLDTAAKVERPARARTDAEPRKRTKSAPKTPSELSDEPANEPTSGESQDLASDSEPAPRRNHDDDDDIEGKYFQALNKDKHSTHGDEQNDQDLHTRTPKVATATKVDLKEDELDKAERTVFVGNVPAGVVTSKTTQKQFKKLFSEVGPVESVRFRSIAFGEALPRKAAFAQKKLHGARDSVNAYVVFKEKAPSRQAVSRLNAREFDHHHLRVDHVAHPVAKDNKRTIFVGNLDFEALEEELWRYFNLHTDNDVESVRVVRDSKTNLGKGFALVQFRDSLSVNKCILLNDKPMSKDSKRKLRILRANARAKPSVLSPNHIDNVKKARTPKQQLSEAQKSKLGRANAVLGRADRATIGKVKPIIEGQRARKGDRPGKKKKPRIRERTQKYKENSK